MIFGFQQSLFVMLKRQPFIAFRKSSNKEFPFDIYGNNYMNFYNFSNNIIGYADLSFSGKKPEMVKVYVPFKVILYSDC